MRGDDDFEAFYQASYPRLVGQLTILTGSLEDAEDAVQEAFARASTRWARLRDYDAPEAWGGGSSSTWPRAGCAAPVGSSAPWPGWAHRPPSRRARPIGWRSRLACRGCRCITGRSWCCGPLDRPTTPAPVVTQPPPPAQPGASFADELRARFDDMLVDLTVVPLASGRAGDEGWRLAAVRDTSRRSHEDKVCLAHRTDGRSHGYGYSCRDAASNRPMDRMTFRGGGTEGPLWGLVPQATARVRLLRSGAPPVEVPATEIGPGFRRRYYLALSTPGVRSALGPGRTGTRDRPLPADSLSRSAFSRLR